MTFPLGADGTTRVVTGQTSILPKTSAQQGQSLINKLQPSAHTAVAPGPSNPQKVHILKSPDGKLQVRGLMPGMINIRVFI
jgi:nucleosome-remodeling factor subunit BPTF